MAKQRFLEANRDLFPAENGSLDYVSFLDKMHYLHITKKNSELQHNDIGVVEEQDPKVRVYIDQN